MKYTFLTATLFIFFHLSLTAQENRDLPGAPENAPAKIQSSSGNQSIVLQYNNSQILKGVFRTPVKITSTTAGEEIITQQIRLSSAKPQTFKLSVYGSTEAFAAETRGKAQQQFPLIRTSHGLSNNLRNNAVYDRNSDWMLEFPEGTIIKSYKEIDGTTRFEVMTHTQNEVLITFRPRYYQKHKNLPFFQPWTYNIYKESITGWSSWWAFFREFTEEDNRALLDVWKRKHFADYGYRFIQIDDGFQGEYDKNRKNSKLANGYYGGRPTTWLDWRKDRFPNGLTGYVNDVKTSGFDPAIWMGCFFSDTETVKTHPDWFVTGKNGKPVAAPWVSYVMDASKEEVAKNLIRPTFKGLKNAGVQYVKIDQLRHFLYDNLHNNLNWFKDKDFGPGELLRTYMGIAREELGDDTFILACWGVLPETIGLADACRIGGDGYGPVTMQQYNSWNGIVWRNDPDHCDVAPNKKAAETGNVKKTTVRKSEARESIIRPALASIAGAMLMLSDKPEIYENDELLYGLRRAAPVLFSVPGQLYDYDPAKTDWIKNHKRTEIKSGKSPTPIDGDQFGEVCTFWLNEFNTPFEEWVVLHRLNWSEKKRVKLKPVTVRFADLGLDPAKEYLVFEFWKQKMLGIFKGDFKLGELETHGLESLAIREKLDRPQLISTNRHLSQGAAEIEKLTWENNTLKGRSRMIVDDNYIMTFYVPDGYPLKKALVNGKPADTKLSGQILKVSYRPEKTASLSWEIEFEID